jgi:hypothetical protein
MIEGIEQLYQAIAESIEQAIPDDWTTARMEAVFYPGSSDYVGEYIRKADGKVRAFSTGRLGERAFREIRKKFKEAGKPLWGQAIFELHSDGKFNMKWGYDDVDENGDTTFNENEYLNRNEERRKRLIAE